MKVTLEDISENLVATVQDDSVLTATDTVHLVFQAMLGIGYQKESIVDALLAVAEEYEL